MADDFLLDAPGGRFPATRRSAVCAVASDDPAERARSFEILVRAYYKPAYKYLRLRYHTPAEEARDVTQGFFARAFEKRWFASFDPARARFRTYLKTCLDHFAMEQARNERRQKRGGDAIRIDLDFEAAEAELAGAAGTAPGGVEEAFDREWVRGRIEAAVDALREACAAAGRPERFTVFQRYVLDDEAARPTYAELGAELGLSVTDVTNHLAFGRRELRKLVLARLRELTATEEEFREEARAVLGASP
jgi:RNA polymerase sigma factor (sigma-70 family)